MSKQLIRSATAVMIVLLGAQVARSETWRTYHNARFAMSGEYPSSWIALPPPVNGDGRSFRAPGTRATITISGSSLHGSLKAAMDSRRNPDEGEEITYTRQGANWIVVSGVGADKIFYRKSFISCGIVREVSIEYPIPDKRRYDSLVEHVANSLRSDSDWNAGPCL